MHSLTDSHEWLLLRELSEWLSQRKAPYHAIPINQHRNNHFDADLLEFELRRAFFTVQRIPQILDPEKFIYYHGILKQLCSLLDRLAAHQRTHGDSKGEDYPHLEALIGHLNPTCDAIVLVNGPEQRLFELPSELAALRDCLTSVTECNNALDGLLTPTPLESVIQPSQRERKRSPWKSRKIRDQATCVLKALFKHFKCGIPHEVLLKLIESPNEDLIVSSLQLMLPSCPELKSWHEVQCDDTDLDDDSILPIPDVCTGIKEYTDQETAIMLYIKEYKIYVAKADPVSSGLGPSSKGSLDQLIKNGAFKSIDAGDFNIRPSSVRFSIRDKRKLAVKFGYCLMDFFDADFASNRIHFFGSSNASLMEIPYLAFSSNFPITDDSYNFQLGHPTFLSFAKLLIELEIGGNIELEVSPDSHQNIVVWAKVMKFTDDLEKERKDSYREAITSCLLFHKMVDSGDSDSKDADSIRRIIYEQIVYKLECGLKESVPRSKRQRSESPPVPDPQDPVQTEDSWNMATKSMDSQRATFRNKRQRGFEFQPRSFLDITRRETYSSLNNGFSKLKATIRLDRPSSREDFEIALICALPKESNAVEALFGGYYEEDYSYGKAAGDPNAYTTGRMAGHNVVLAFMPGMGKVNSANVAAGFRMSFPNIKLGLVVGICGGVPGGEDGENEVLLGDVIISTALIQYDFGRQYDSRVVRRDTLQDNLSRPNAQIRSFLTKYSGLKGCETLRGKTFSYLDDLCAKAGFEKSAYPGADKDVLYHPKYRHKHRNAAVCSACSRCRKPSDNVCDSALELSCADLGCDDSMIISRARIEKAKSTASSTAASRDEDLREAWKPLIHFGKIASGDLVIKSGRHRDKIAVREKVIAFEMEGAGVWDSFPTVVIKSVCDYADSHKNKTWQRYAAATAAACSKAFLEEWRKAC